MGSVDPSIEGAGETMITNPTLLGMFYHPSFITEGPRLKEAKSVAQDQLVAVNTETHIC